MSAQDLATLVRDGVLIPDKDLEEDTRRRYSMPAKRPLSEARKDNPNVGKKSPDEMKTLVETAGVLIDRGYAPETALEAVGLNPIVPDAPGNPPAADPADVARAESVLRNWIDRNGGAS